MSARHDLIEALTPDQARQKLADRRRRKAENTRNYLARLKAKAGETGTTGGDVPQQLELPLTTEAG